MFTPYQYQHTPRAVGRALTSNHSRAVGRFGRPSPYRPAPVVGRALTANHSRAIGRGLSTNHSRAISAALRG